MNVVHFAHQSPKQSTNKSMKGEIHNANDWTGEEANLADRITEFCKEFLFSCNKFLKDGWKTFNPENEKSFSYFVGKNMAKHMRIIESQQWAGSTRMNGKGFMFQQLG